MTAFSRISTLTFEKDLFEKEYNSVSVADSVNSEEALRRMYDFSVIGYERRSGYGGTGWYFKYIDENSSWDNSATRFKVHLGLKEFAKLRETRQTG